ncbi:MAG: hypothetical protein KDD25_02270 [Bdellovibrionales bacterium]|nr:hypothetical protein [Bdellovibrionales bacterium]
MPIHHIIKKWHRLKTFVVASLFAASLAIMGGIVSIVWFAKVQYNLSKTIDIESKKLSTLRSLLRRVESTDWNSKSRDDRYFAQRSLFEEMRASGFLNLYLTPEQSQVIQSKQYEWPIEVRSQLLSEIQNDAFQATEKTIALFSQSRISALLIWVFAVGTIFFGLILPFFISMTLRRLTIKSKRELEGALAKSVADWNLLRSTEVEPFKNPRFYMISLLILMKHTRGLFESPIGDAFGDLASLIHTELDLPENPAQPPNAA